MHNYFFCSVSDGLFYHIHQKWDDRLFFFSATIQLFPTKRVFYVTLWNWFRKWHSKSWEVSLPEPLVGQPGSPVSLATRNRLKSWRNECIVWLPPGPSLPLILKRIQTQNIQRLLGFTAGEQSCQPPKSFLWWPAEGKTHLTATYHRTWLPFKMQVF